MISLIDLIVIVEGGNESTNIQNAQGKYHVKIMLKDVFGFAEHQEETTYGLGFKIALTRNKSNAVFNKAEAIADAGNTIDHIH